MSQIEPWTEPCCWKIEGPREGEKKKCFKKTDSHEEQFSKKETSGLHPQNPPKNTNRDGEENKDGEKDQDKECVRKKARQESRREKRERSGNLGEISNSHSSRTCLGSLSHW